MHQFLILLLLPSFVVASAIDSQPGDRPDKPVTITIETNSLDVVVNVIHTPDQSDFDETEIDFVERKVKGFPPFPPLDYPHITHAEYDSWLKNVYAKWLCGNSQLMHEDIFTCAKLKYSNIPESNQDITINGFPVPLPDNFPFPRDDIKNQFAKKYVSWRCKAVVTQNAQIAACNRWLPVLNSLKIGVDELGSPIE